MIGPPVSPVITPPPGASRGEPSLITFFTSLKPMTGRTAVHQANAIGSWLAVPDAEILLFGPQAPAPHPRIRHVAETPCNEFGTPLLDVIFARARELARHDLVCFINGDIILVDGPDRIAGRLARRRGFLVVGRRHNVVFDDPIDFASEWRPPLRALARAVTGPTAGNAIDYFLFPRQTAIAMPPFAIGRPAWDNWMVMDARRQRRALIDATRVILAVHPFHGHDHVPARTGLAWNGPEADVNHALARADQPGFNPGLHTINSANWVATRLCLLPAWTPARWRTRRRARRNRRFSAA